MDARPAKPAAGESEVVPTIEIRAPNEQTIGIRLEGTNPGNYQRFNIRIEGREAIVENAGKELQKIPLPGGPTVKRALGLRDPGGAVEFMNIYVREL